MQKILEESFPKPKEPIRLESEGVFSPTSLSDLGLDSHELIDNPMAAIMKPIIQYFEAIRPPMAFTAPPKSEHKVRIFRLSVMAKPKEIAVLESAIETLLNDGYCYHMPTVVNDYVIMDFSRRKEIEEDATI